MTKIKRIQGTVVSTRVLSQDDKDLLEEIKSLRIASLKNLTDAFRQLITLSTAIIGLQIAVLKVPENPVFKTWETQKILVLISLVCLLAATFISCIGQQSNRINISTLNLLEIYRQQRDTLINKGYRLYAIANIMFLAGLVTFIINFIFSFS